MRTKDITLEKLLNAPKYRKLSLIELEHVINWDLQYDDYNKLNGEGSYDKAELLYVEWHGSLNPEITGEETQHLLKEMNMEGQMLHQLMMTQPFEDVQALFNERVHFELNNKG